MKDLLTNLKIWLPRTYYLILISYLNVLEDVLNVLEKVSNKLLKHLNRVKRWLLLLDDYVFSHLSLVKKISTTY